LASLAEKYLEGRDEIANFIRSASDLMAEINFLLQYGLWRLNRGMHWWKYVDKKPSFDPTLKPPPYPYGEKNLYVNASNNLWRFSMWPHYNSINEMYYSVLLAEIKKFKKNYGNFDFNKGIVYANLGVSQSAQMKLDEGFANILKALIEDYPYADTDPESNVWKNPLFTQFEKQYLRTPLQAIISQLGMAAITSTEVFVENFLNSLSNDQRGFLEYTFIRIMQNHEIWKEKENGLSANRLLAYTQDLCLFNEAFLKSKFSLLELAALKKHELGWLIPPKFGVNCRGCSANDISVLASKLSHEMGESDSKKRCA
jgi:hypothetical protein